MSTIVYEQTNFFRKLKYIPRLSFNSVRTFPCISQHPTKHTHTRIYIYIYTASRTHAKQVRNRNQTQRIKETVQTISFRNFVLKIHYTYHLTYRNIHFTLTFLEFTLTIQSQRNAINTFLHHVSSLNLWVIQQSSSDFP